MGFGALWERAGPPHLIPPVINAVAALHRQNADIDADSAYDLTEQACGPLEYEVERTEYLLASDARKHRQHDRRLRAHALRANRWTWRPWAFRSTEVRA